MYTYETVIEDVHDGDTFKANIDLGFSIFTKRTFRMLGINAPELKLDTKEAGIKSRDVLRELILGKRVIIKSTSMKQEKYGRYLAKVFLINEDGTVGINVNQYMIDNNLAIPFMVE